MATASPVEADVSKSTGIVAACRDVFRRWSIERCLYCNEDDYSVEEWNALHRRYIAAGGTDERWYALAEERLLP
jgi:hypothetical protein